MYSVYGFPVCKLKELLRTGCGFKVGEFRSAVADHITIDRKPRSAIERVLHAVLSPRRSVERNLYTASTQYLKDIDIWNARMYGDLRCHTCGGRVSQTEKSILRPRHFCCGSCSSRHPDTLEKSRATSMKRYGVPSASHSPAAIAKRNATVKRVYGVDNPSQSAVVKRRKVETSMRNYGVPNPIQSKEVQDRIRQGCMERYGVPSAAMRESVKMKIRNTNLSRWGSVCTLNNPEVLAKKTETFQVRYGGHPLRTDAVRQKIKSSFLKNYGTTTPSKLESVKKKTQETNYLRYGCRHSMQNPEVARRNAVSNATARVITRGGVEFNLRGYEPQALDLLIDIYGEGRVSQPTCGFPYTCRGKRRKYYPDFLAGSVYVEVKSTYTAGVQKDRARRDQDHALLKAKMRAVEIAGYRIRCLIQMPRGWIVLKSSAFRLADVRKAIRTWGNRSGLLVL